MRMVFTKFYCRACGGRQQLQHALVPCVHCGGLQFRNRRPRSYDEQLTEDDVKRLKEMRIAEKLPERTT
jgi:hypothetical protein